MAEHDYLFHPRRPLAPYLPMSQGRLPPPDVAPVELQNAVHAPASAPGPERAANTAYWRHNPTPPPEVPPVGRQLLPSTAPTAARAANTAYWRGGDLPAAAITPPGDLPEGVSLFPEAAPGPRRAGYEAYQAGGGTVGLFAWGAVQPGCPYRPSIVSGRRAPGVRPGSASATPATRPQGSAGFGAGRPNAPDATPAARPSQPSDAPPTRPDECR